MLLSVLVLIACSMFAQEQSHAHRVPTASIVGAHDPSAIPDSVAYRLVFLAFSEPLSPSSEQIRRQNSKLSSINLSPSDQTRIKEIIGRFQNDYQSLEAEFKAKKSATDSRGIEFSQRQSDLVNNTKATIESHLTSEGKEKFAQFVQREKARMTISSFPKMP
jgi:methionine-rich copper-binding protein CopC